MQAQRVIRSLLMAAWVITAVSCHDPVEYDTTAVSGVAKIRVADHTVIGTAGGIEDGRSLCSLGNSQFLVASGNGILYRFDSEAMMLDTSFSIGFGSGAGHGAMVLPKPGSVYVIGAAGKIIEVGLQTNSVLDEFDAGPLPRALCTASENQRLFVADGSDCRIREVDTGTNLVLRETEPLDAVPVSLVAETFQNDYLLAGCTNPEGTVGRVSLATFYTGSVFLESACTGITAFPAESIWAAAHPDWSEPHGRISICSNFYLPDITEVQVDGHPVDICSVPGTTLFYVLSYLGNGSSRVTAVNYFAGGIVAEIDLPGFPWDITSHANGQYVLVLTSEL